MCIISINIYIKENKICVGTFNEWLNEKESLNMPVCFVMCLRLE